MPNTLNFIKVAKINNTSINMHTSEIVIEVSEPKYKPRFKRVTGATTVTTIVKNISLNAKSEVLHLDAIKYLRSIRRR